MKAKINWYTVFLWLYFLALLSQVIGEYLLLTHISVGCRILIPVLLGLLYLIRSDKQQFVVYALLILHLCSSIFFVAKGGFLFSIAVITFLLVRVFQLVIIYRQTPVKNYLHIVSISFPFLLIFFYLISVTDDISEYQFNLLILQSILIALLSGFSISNYFGDENRANSWLLISTLLFIGLRFIVFIERYITADFSFLFNRPIAALLSAFAFFSFIKYVLAAESDKKIVNNHG